MITTVVTAVMAYISTNIDDIFVLVFLLCQVRGTAKGRSIAGHFLGVGMITLVSMLGALGLQKLPLKYVGLLGLVPIGLGIRAWLCRDHDEETGSDAVGLWGMALITLGNGADNVGVYLPLFTGFSASERVAATVVFALMTAVWVWLANSLAGFPKVKTAIGRYKTVLVPLVFIALGGFIILESGLF